MKHQSDLENWQKIVAGDATAFSELFYKYYKPLYQFAGRFVKDAQSAENIVQEIFVNLWLNRNTLNIKSNLKIYLFSSVKNQSLNYLAKQKRIDALEQKIEGQKLTENSVEENYLKKEWRQAVLQAIDRLPQQCRQVYTMKRYNDLKYSEIAEILNISVNTVKTQMKRAIKSLFKNLSHLLSILF